MTEEETTTGGSEAAVTNAGDCTLAYEGVDATG